MNHAKPVTVAHVRHVLEQLGGWGSIYIPEFTWRGLRIDALIMNTRSRSARGFEIKVSRSDFLRDEKWHMYSEFCSSLSIACPEGLLAKEEVPDPFGLLYVLRDPVVTDDLRSLGVKWEKKPKKLQCKPSLAWTYTYLAILEMELPRLALEVKQLRHDLRRRDDGLESRLGQ